MKVCLLGEFFGYLDEGMRVASVHLAKELSKSSQILQLDLRHAFSKDFWKSLNNFKPEIVHYLHGPTARSFLLLKTISLKHREAKTVISATRPSFSSVFKILVPLVKPSVILTMSYQTREAFRELGCKTEFLPCGVDVERFRPATIDLKCKLRKKYGIEQNKFVILHVGSIKRERNVQLLSKLQNEENQVIIVGARSVGTDPYLKKQLGKSGCWIWANYFKRIDEIYALSDCYVYPTISKKSFLGRSVTASIEMPLSVLEAMACNLRVVSTRFGSLPEVFKEGNGLTFAEEEEFESAIETVKNIQKVETRDKVLEYSWKNVAERLQQIYQFLLSNDGEAKD
ncbi:MAG: glycosyltransferase family 4 protein [Candidatus Bathyarchaeota archaeon]|nr:glycosyltransferase family 4 protein [Candidatus Bathyarchaeota archaeon]MDH5689838.1 glycosyltransferase family 4 protein [Candidatus Bathyarchaeota archaeon]